MHKNQIILKKHTSTLQKNSIALLTIFIFLISLSSCKTSQVNSNNPVAKKEVNYIPYYLKVYEADSLFLTNNYNRSYEILDSLFQKYEPLQMENYYEYGNYIASSVMSGHTADIDAKIKKGYLSFGDVGFNHPESFKIRQEIVKFSKLTKIEKEQFRLEYSKKINLDLRKIVSTMDDEDQSVRMNNYNAEGIKFFQEKHKKEIEEIISKYGYPTYQIIGSMGYSDGSDTSFKPIAFTTIFLHQDMSVKEKYLPMMLEGVKKGTFLPSEYASIFDKSIWQKTSEKSDPKQLYGTFPGVALINQKKIDSIRKTIGLPHLGYEDWAFKKIFNEGSK